MKKTYLLIHAPSLGTPDEIKGFLNRRKEIISWRVEIPNCIFIISESDESYLSGLFRGFDKANASFMVMEVSPKRQGWMTEDTWKFLKGELNANPAEEDVPF